MRFKFCGGLDAPDWFLRETVVVSQLSAVRFKLIVIVVYRHLLGAPLDYDKLDRYLSVGGEKRTASDVKALVAAITFILNGGSKYEVSVEDLKRELTQVGLPREHGLMLARPYGKYGPQLTRRLQSKALKMDRVKNVQWRVDYIIARSSMRSVTEGAVEGQLSIVSEKHNEEDPIVFTLSREKAAILLTECKTALQLMQDYTKK